MIDGSKLMAKCGNPKCGKEYPVRIGALATIACQVCGSTLVTLIPQVITKEVIRPPEVPPIPDAGMSQDGKYHSVNEEESTTKEKPKRGRKPGRKQR